MKDLSKESLFALLTGLLVIGCEKPAQTPEPEPARSEVKTTAAAPVNVEAKEVPRDAGAAGASDKAQSCAPGGCAPGKCGGK